MSRWLVLDIGNTHTVAALFDEGALEKRARFRTDPESTSDELRVLLEQLSLWPKLERVIASTVVAPMERIVREACGPVPCLFINAETRREFELDLPKPYTIGADRLANVAGALTLAHPPFLIVDAGTATTFCLVDSRPAHIGGAIAPGLVISKKALHTFAPRLSNVDLARESAALGKSSEAQLRTGLIQGHEAMIEELSNRLLAEAGFKETPTLFATGGVNPCLRLSSRFRVELDLTLKGILRYGQLTQ